MKITPPARRPTKTAAGGRPSALSRWNRRDALSLQVVHRGGAESYWEVRARGRIWRRPGWISLEDLMAEIHSGTGGVLPDPTQRGTRRR